MNLNRVILIGRLTQDIRARALPSGIMVATSSLVTNRIYQDQNKQKKETATFHNIVAFGKQAETLSRYAVKGSLLQIEGRIENRSWDKEGVKQYRTEIIIEKFQFGPKSQSSGTSQQSRFTPKDTESDANQVEFPEGAEGDEDIPF